jgi:hypothetical protein
MFTKREKVTKGTTKISGKPEPKRASATVVSGYDVHCFTSDGRGNIKHVSRQRANWKIEDIDRD